MLCVYDSHPCELDKCSNVSGMFTSFSESLAATAFRLRPALSYRKQQKNGRGTENGANQYYLWLFQFLSVQNKAEEWKCGVCEM